MEEQKKKINKKFALIISVILIIGIVYGGYQYIHALSHETTDDAQVDANMNPIIPRVGGYIQQVFVSDNAKVEKGDTLFTIDKRDYMVKLKQAQANLAAAKSQLSVAKASVNSYQANVTVSAAQVNVAEGSIESAEINRWRAENDFKRYKNLYKNHSITAQQYEKALAAKQQADQQLQILKSKQKASAGQKNSAVSQSKISEKQVAVALADVESAKALLEAAKLNIDYTVVTAPISGQLSAVELQPGQFVQPGQSLFYLVNTQKKWIVANFKETQLSQMEIGQKVSLEIDAFPDIEFEGMVTAFSPATGAQFSLLPPDNATGNFVKTIQRLPVKINFTKDNDPEKLQKLRSGMNVFVDVHLK